jgi:hypothetical protein
MTERDKLIKEIRRLEDVLNIKYKAFLKQSSNEDLKELAKSYKSIIERSGYNAN